MKDVTRILKDWSDGDPSAIDALMPLVYGELRRMAGRVMRLESAGHTLQPTALVHEAYLRLVDQTRVNWQNRAHFFAVAAQVIRRILVDHARARHRLKRGGGALRITLDEKISQDDAAGLDLAALDSALIRLSALDERQGRIVELRFFGGLSIEETAEVLSISTATVKRDWTSARAWLFRELSWGQTPQ